MANLAKLIDNADCTAHPQIAQDINGLYKIFDSKGSKVNETQFWSIIVYVIIFLILN